MDRDMKRRAIIRITYEILVEMMEMPPGIQIMSVVQEPQDQKTEALKIIVGGLGLSEKYEVPESGTPRQIDFLGDFLADEENAR